MHAQLFKLIYLECLNNSRGVSVFPQNAVKSCKEFLANEALDIVPQSLLLYTKVDNALFLWNNPAVKMP